MFVSSTPGIGTRWISTLRSTPNAQHGRNALGNGIFEDVGGLEAEARLRGRVTECGRDVCIARAHATADMPPIVSAGEQPGHGDRTSERRAHAGHPQCRPDATQGAAAGGAGRALAELPPAASIHSSPRRHAELTLYTQRTTCRARRITAKRAMTLSRWSATSMLTRSLSPP